MKSLENIVDPFGMISSLRMVCDNWLQHSEELKQKMSDLIARTEDLSVEVVRKYVPENGVAGPEEEKEFIDHIRENATLARKYYSLYSSWLRDFVETVPGLGENERRRAIFWVNQYLNAIAPSNFFWTNPGAVQKFIESDGASLIYGYINWLEDSMRQDNLLKIVDDKAFKLGKNLATTKGYVVFKNELIELIQYSPVTDETYPVPVLFIQPWINKYYIFDLTEQTSFVRYLLNRGFSVFIISWKNPGADMRSITFEDYVFKGVREAIEAAGEICGTGCVHAAGYCIGGTALAIMMAWLNGMRKAGDAFPVADWSVFSTLVDFSDPGEIGVFISEESITYLESLMKSTGGYLDSKYISQTFRLLRSDSLVWRNYVHNYLYGGTPPKSDMLYWNDDSTRMPEAMCSFYLRECYLHNKLIRKGSVVMRGCPIDLECIEQPLYAVGAQQDHISPWRSTFRIGSLVNCPVRYVLASEGHIAGIVNPPSELSRRKFWAGGFEGSSGPDAWQSQQQEQRGSWWPDWVEWLIPRSGKPGSPPAMGSKKYPPLGKAPGSYAREL